VDNEVMTCGCCCCDSTAAAAAAASAAAAAERSSSAVVAACAIGWWMAQPKHCHHIILCFFSDLTGRTNFSVKFVQICKCLNFPLTKNGCKNGFAYYLGVHNFPKNSPVL
jgi:hypothetical protein